MTRCVIDINDAGIQISDATGIQRVSPGFAFAQGNELLTGEQAAARMRTNPRAGSDLFWSQLSQTPLPRTVGPARSYADLAWYHLRDLWQPIANRYQQVVLTVSGDYDEQRLSTLLGITRACDMPVRSVVAAAVAASATHTEQLADRAELLFLDAQWHRMIAETVRMDADTIALGRVYDSLRHGIAALHERWAHMIAEAFLQSTRFDPMHNASSEQQLYNALPDWLQQLQEQPQISLQLNSGQHSFSIDLEQQQFNAAVSDLYQPLLQLVDSLGQPLLLGQRLTMLPGLVQQLREHAEVVIVSSAATTSGLLARADDLLLDSDEITHHLSLPRSGQRQPQADVEPRLAPTHISDTTHVWPLAPASISLSPARPPRSGKHTDAVTLQQQPDGGWLLHVAPGIEVCVNEQQHRHASTVFAGDRISIAERSYQLLHLLAPADA